MLLGSERYVKAKLEGLSAEQLCVLRAVVRRNRHPRFRTAFGGPGGGNPYFTREEWEVCIGAADSAKLARLIKIIGMLMQTKVYLFWSQPLLK